MAEIYTRDNIAGTIHIQFRDPVSKTSKAFTVKNSSLDKVYNIVLKVLKNDKSL